MKKIIIAIFLLTILAIIASNLGATPGFSIWSGLKCSECHANYQGGGMRTAFGWQFGKDAAMFLPEELGLSSVYSLLDKEKYWISDSLFSMGADFRYQTVRSHKTENAVRKYFPMQASLYANLEPAEWLGLNGQYNFGPKIFPGQRMWSAAALIKTPDRTTAVRLGYFQPSIGLRDCDMTSLDRRLAASDGSETLIPPDFAEWGAEIIHDGTDWLHFNLGMFDSQSLSEDSLFGGQIPLILGGNPSFNIRALIYPAALFDDFPDSYFGASAFVNGEFIYSNIFAGFPVFEDLNIYFQYAGSNKPLVRKSVNYIAGINYMPLKGLFLGVRGETGSTALYIDEFSYFIDTRQVVLNARIFLAPYIEFIPEYRLLDTREYRSTRWACQFHFYY